MDMVHGMCGFVEQFHYDPCMDLWPDYLIEADVLQLECKFSRSVNCCVLSCKNSYSGIDLHGLFISSTWFCPPCFYSSSFPCSCFFVLVSILRQTSSRSFCAYLAYIQPFHHPLDLILGKMWGDRFTSYICIAYFDSILDCVMCMRLFVFGDCSPLSFLSPVPGILHASKDCLPSWWVERWGPWMLNAELQEVMFGEDVKHKSGPMFD